MAVSRRNFDLGRTAIWLGAVIVAAAISFGWVGLEFSPLIAGLGFALLAAIAYAVGQNEDELSITFALSLLAVLMVVWEFLLPEAIRMRLPFQPLLEGIDVLTYVVVISLVILVWWVLDIRFISGRAKEPDRVVNQLGNRIERLFGYYITATRVSFMIGVGIGLIVLNQIGVLTGDLASIVGEVPYLAADLVTLLVGYLALGGDVPYLNGIPFVREIGATGFLVIGAVTLVIAIGVKYAD